MKKYSNEEMKLIKSLWKPIDNIDINLVNSIINKIIENKDYEELIDFLNNLYDFTDISINIVDKLIRENNKECISTFLENEDFLYFLTEREKEKLKSFLNVYEVNIKLKESYDYYFDLLFKKGVRHFQTKKIGDTIIEHKFIRYNKLIGIKLKVIKNIGVVVSYINYGYYSLTEEEQLLKEIDYINQFGFNIIRDIKNNAIIRK